MTISENNDLAAKNPDKLKELQGLFMDEAKKYQVLPLDNSILERGLAPRPSAIAGRTEFTYDHEVSGLPDGNAPNMLTKSFSIAADVEIPAGRRRGNAQHARADALAATGSICSRANPSSPTTCSRSNVSAGRVRRHSPPANTPSCSTSNTMAPAWPRAAPASSPWTARKSPERPSRTPSRRS